MQKLIFLLCFLVVKSSFSQPSGNRLSDKFVLVIHGGAGTILRSQMTPEREKAYTDALNAALEKGYMILKNSGTALDAVEAAVNYLEDNPLFNAGKGAVFTNEGKNELDASIMDGKTLAAGSVAGVTIIKNPVSAARAVMEKSPHVMMTGKGAEQFAKEQGLDIVDPSYFYTEDRWESLRKTRILDSIDNLIAVRHHDRALFEALEETLDSLAKSKSLDSIKIKAIKYKADSILEKLVEYDQLYEKLNERLLKNEPLDSKSSKNHFQNRDYKYGTVGAVALDRHGNLAAATSTGGMANKRFGRVGDSPIIGAGTYADNKTAAISCTGWGEFYIRLVLAKTVCDRMEFGKMKLKDAADEMVMKQLPALGGDGGLIAVDKDGNIAMPFCTEGMYRGFVRQDGKRVVNIYKE